jgi:hypothetical protein
MLAQYYESRELKAESSNQILSFKLYHLERRMQKAESSQKNIFINHSYYNWAIKN